MRFRFVQLVVGIGLVVGGAGYAVAEPGPALRPGAGGATKKLARVTLEMSLKPFEKVDPDSVAAVWREALRQWRPLMDCAEKVSVLFWTGDGLEILKWRGEMEDEIEWARYIGYCNVKDGMYLGTWASSRPGRLYIENPPKITYAVLKRIVATLRKVATEEFGLTIEAGTTIDPGPEFVEDDFRYKRHREIMAGGPEGKPWPTLGFINCWATLHADKEQYAGFPNGIPEGTSFGKFLGRQCASFLPAMGFDYIWFSNGFGFSHLAWYLVGANFDGLRFGTTDYEQTARNLLSFWTDYKRECPTYPVEVRGHNYTVGVGLAAHCIRLNDIYGTGLVSKPAPNPPWGSNSLEMELTSQMSRIAHLPGREFVCRLYLNDPWFYTDPWWDYYNREPFDIYCPLAVGRLNERGGIENPRHLELLTIDTEEGELNENTALEVIPHIRRALTTAPDEPGPLLWVYPYDEYDHMARTAPDQVGKAFFYDMFIRTAIREGLPLNTVVSSDNFVEVLRKAPRVLDRTVVVAPTPMPGCRYEADLLAWVRQGGQVCLYGPLDCASPELLEMLRIKLDSSLEGDLQATSTLMTDRYEVAPPAVVLKHRAVVSAGGVCEITSTGSDEHVRLTVSSGQARRAYAVVRSDPQWKGGRLAWIRGTVPVSFTGTSANPQWDPPNRSVNAGLWMRYLLSEFGLDLRQDRHGQDSRPVVQLISRYRNGLFITGHKPDATVSVRWRFPVGAPILTERETRIRDGMSAYYLARSFQEECRILVDQKSDDLIICKEQQHPTGTERRILVTGLKDAAVVVLPPRPVVESGKIDLTAGGKPVKVERDLKQACIHAAKVSGSLMITW